MYEEGAAEPILQPVEGEPVEGQARETGESEEDVVEEKKEVKKNKNAKVRSRISRISNIRKSLFKPKHRSSEAKSDGVDTQKLITETIQKTLREVEAKKRRKRTRRLDADADSNGWDWVLDCIETQLMYCRDPGERAELNEDLIYVSRNIRRQREIPSYIQNYSSSIYSSNIRSLKKSRKGMLFKPIRRKKSF